MASSQARLTSLSTQTSTLLLERQRLSSISLSSSISSSPVSPSFPPPLRIGTTAGDEKIRRNLITLREGIVLFEKGQAGPNGVPKELGDIKAQFERMREMFGDEAIETLVPPPKDPSDEEEDMTLTPTSPKAKRYVPYRDEPIPSPSIGGPTPTPSELEQGYGRSSNGEVFQMQQQMMDDQDNRLDTLSDSINRQRDISLQINSELDVHTGLLEGLDHDLDRTGGRLAGARRSLGKFAKGVKGNASSVFIGLLITVLLLLIVIFKT